MKTLRNIIISLFIAFLCAIFLGSTTIILAMVPKNNQSHIPMPILEFMLGWLVGIITFFVVGIVVFKKLKNKNFTLKISNQFIMILYAVVSVVFVFDFIIYLNG